MKKQRQTNGIHAGEAVIRRPVFEPLLFFSLVLLGISVCFLERPAAESLSELLALEFSVLAEFFI